jgi:GntR family transcriptional regulator
VNDLPALFNITTGSTEPIYQQLVAQVRRRVASGLWLPGVEMPSVRELAQALAVNPMTVSKAYGLLETQGVLERRRGLAMVVAAQTRDAEHDGQREALLRPALERAALEARQLGLSDTRSLALFKTVLKQTTPGERP